MESTNGPGTHTTLAQYYSWYIGFGINYNAINSLSYGAQCALPRTIANPTLSVWFREADAWSSWSGITADKANALTTGDKIIIGALNVNTNLNISGSTTLNNNTTCICIRNNYIK